jgi:hypothetical protein
MTRDYWGGVVRTGADDGPAVAERTITPDPAAVERLKRLMEEEREAKASRFAGRAGRPAKRNILGDLQRRAREVNEMRRKKFTDEEMAAAYRRFKEEKSLEKVAPEFGTSATTLAVNLRQRGYDLGERRFDIDKEVLDALYRRYVRGEQMPVLAAEVATRETTLGRRFRQGQYDFPLTKAGRQALAAKWDEEERAAEQGEGETAEAQFDASDDVAAAEEAGAPALDEYQGEAAAAGLRIATDRRSDWPLGCPSAAYLVQSPNGNGNGAAGVRPLRVVANYGWEPDEVEAAPSPQPPDLNRLIETLTQFRKELAAAGYGLEGTLKIGGPVAITLHL